ncbi:Putative transposase (identified by ISEscan HMM) [Escherichia coli]|nr:Putative transposase (identified by ISEscan HMM) [Escherichia coli]VCZ22038.1 Putative transposase (identified by ISEscan HMM) [Escherichia coli]
MHELEVLLSRLKMEHLSYHVESLLEQAAKKELNYREFLCMALQQEWNGRHQRGMESKAEAGSSAVGQNAGAVRLYLPAGHRP